MFAGYIPVTSSIENPRSIKASGVLLYKKDARMNGRHRNRCVFETVFSKYQQRNIILSESSADRRPVRNASRRGQKGRSNYLL